MFLEKVIRALDNHKVTYRLVGGYAVALHGAVRGTVDIDIVIAFNKKSFQQVEKAMRSIGLASRLPVTAEEVFLYREEYIANKNLIAWPFVNANNPLEMVDVIITQDAKQVRHVVKKTKGLNIKVASIEDLIRIKKQSNRKQDKEDIKALEKIR